MRWLRLLAAAASATLADGLLDAAAALAFYFMFALFPTILLVAAILGTFHLQALVANLVVVLTRGLPHHAAELVSSQLGSLLQHNVPGLLSFDLVILFYSASQGFAGLMTALNTAYDVKETRGFVHRVAVQFALTLSSGVLIAVALAIVLLGEKLFVIVAGPVHTGAFFALVSPVLRWAFTLLVMIYALRLLYRFAPNRAPAESGSLLAIATAMVIWIVASALLASYVNHFATYSAVYGSLGAVIALMLWFYLLSLAILFGAELHHAWLEQSKTMLV